MSALEEKLAKVLDLLEVLAKQPQPEIHVHVHTSPAEQFAKQKKSRNEMDAEGAHEGHEFGNMENYPRPYVG